jgi:hypothetical protein
VRLYAERPGRVARQVTTDVLSLGWLAAFGWLAVQGHALMLRLRSPATGLVNAGASIDEAFAGAARTAARVPFVGEQLAVALGGGSAAGRSLAEVGSQQYSAISTLALGTALVVFLVGALPLLVVWVPLRLRYARAAGAAAASRTRDADLLALRALTRVPVRRLRLVSADPAAGWRRADPELIRELAALELRRLGLRAGPRTG